MEIRPIHEFTPEMLEAVAPNGYTAEARYELALGDRADGGWDIALVKRLLPTPYVRRWGEENNDFELYEDATASGFCFGAFEGNRLVGVCLAEMRIWNASIFVHMLQVAGEYQRRGIGAALLETLCAKAKEAHFRLIDLETQNFNTRAIDFYLKQGFTLGGVDWMLYDPKVVEKGELALFLKKRL